MESFLQAKLTELERAAYLEFLMSLNPGVMDEAVESVVLNFKPERTRLPLPSEFLEFIPEVTQREEEHDRSRRARWRLQFEMENADGSVDRAREEFRRKLEQVAGKHGF